MDTNLYQMIFKRKSFHLFRNVGNGKITQAELDDLQNYFNNIVPLVSDIKVKMEIVKDEPSCKRGQEYCLFLYSEKKDNYLQNIGYIGEQIDLYLVSKNIGTLWFGLGKPKQTTLDGLDYVIMFAIKKIDSEDKFRKDMYKSKRKDVAEIWHSDNYPEIADVVRFAPSACNSQPWLVEGTENALQVYRYTKHVKIGIMSIDKANYFNQIDIGIFLCILELCLLNAHANYERTVFVEENYQNEKNLTATYKLNRIINQI